MASGRIVVEGFMPALDLNGSPIPGARLTFFLNKTNQLEAIYTDPELTVAHTNPVIADVGGQFPSIFADPATTFTVDLADASGAPVGFASRDNVRAIGQPGAPSDEQVAAALTGIVGVIIIPRVASITSLRAISWPDGRPDRISLDTLYEEADGGGKFLWVPGSTDTDDGATVIKEASTTTGRWFREGAAVHGPRTVTLETLGAVGDGVTNDTPAFVKAMAKMLQGWNVFGYGRYLVDPNTVVLNADNNTLWQDPYSPRIGCLNIPGLVRLAAPGILFNVIGNQGGAKGHVISLGQFIGPGVGDDEDYEDEADRLLNGAIGVKLKNSGFSVTIGEATDFDYSVQTDGCWAGSVYIGQGLAAVSHVISRMGSNGSTTNGVQVHIDHVGGPFSNGTTPERALRSPQYAIDLDYWNGGPLYVGAAEYSHRGDENCAVRLGQDATQVVATFYLEGVEPNNPNSNLLKDHGRNNSYVISSTDTPNVALGGIEIDGINCEMKGVGSRTGPASRQFITAEDGAGPIDIWPGNRWTGAKTAHIDKPNLTDAFNLNLAGFSGLVVPEGGGPAVETLFWAAGNCAVEIVDAGDDRLHPAANYVAGAILTTNNAAGARFISTRLDFSEDEKGRVMSGRQYVTLMEGSESCNLTFYLLKDILEDPEDPDSDVIGFEVLTYDNGFSHGVKVADRTYRLDIKDMIPAGVTQARVCLTQRRSQMPEPIVTAATKSNPLTVTIPGHAMEVGSKVAFFEIDGMTQLTGLTLTVSGVAGDVLTFAGTNSTAWGTFTRGITAATRTNPLTVTMPGHTYIVGNSVSFSGVPGMVELNGQTLTITAIAGPVLTFGGVDATEYSAFTGRDGFATSETISVLWHHPVVSFWDDPAVDTDLVPAGPDILRDYTLLAPLRPTSYLSNVTGSGVLDCRRAPQVIIETAAATVQLFANVKEHGTFEVINRRGADVNIGMGAFTGGAEAGRILLKGCRMTLSVVDGLIYPDSDVA